MDQDLKQLVNEALAQSGGTANLDPLADGLGVREEDFARMARAFGFSQERLEELFRRNLG